MADLTDPTAGAAGGPGAGAAAGPAASPAASSGLRIEAVDIDHPDAARLVEQVQAEYVVRYGGRDDTPLEPVSFRAPRGRFFVGYLDVETPDPDGGPDVGTGDPGRVAVATGAWRLRDDVEVCATTRTAEIKRMFVVAWARNRGLARAMLAHVEQTAAAAGAEAMVLETGIAQPEAIALYGSCGYRAIASFGHYRDSPSNRCFAKSLA